MNYKAKVFIYFRSIVYNFVVFFKKVCLLFPYLKLKDLATMVLKPT